MIKIVAALALVLSAANAACPNACSGHGTCNVNDVCECFQNWQSGDEAGGDCSDRTCPFDIAWADTPTGEDVAHGYAECSAKGVCNRKQGLCECFDGYTGQACKRTTCPNDCSGHGTCEYIADAYGAVARDDAVVQAHDLLGDLWDAKKSRMCVCDPKWTDVDCSRRMCPKGVDVLDRSGWDTSTCDTDTTDSREVQTICNIGAVNGEFAIVYTDQYGAKYTTKALDAHASAETVEAALNSLPDQTLEVSVTGTAGETDCDEGWVITFEGDQNPGKQTLLGVTARECQEGCQPRISGMGSLTSASSDADQAAVISVGYGTAAAPETVGQAEGQLYECGRRGKCDYETGVCECFSGFTDESCGTQSALA